MLERITPIRIMWAGVSVAAIEEAAFVPRFAENGHNANILPLFALVWGTVGLTMLIADLTDKIQNRRLMANTAERVNEYLIKRDEFAVPRRLEASRDLSPNQTPNLEI